MDTWLVSHLGCCEQGSRNPDGQKSMLTQLPFCLHPGESLGFYTHRCPWENCPLIIWVKGPVYFAANISLELLGAEGMAQWVSPHRHLLASPKIWVQPLEPMEWNSEWGNQLSKLSSDLHTHIDTDTCTHIYMNAHLYVYMRAHMNTYTHTQTLLRLLKKM